MSESVTIGKIVQLSPPDPVAALIGMMRDALVQAGADRELEFLTREEIQTKLRRGKTYFFRVVAPHLIRLPGKDADRYTLASYIEYVRPKLVDAHGRHVHKRRAGRTTANPEPRTLNP